MLSVLKLRFSSLVDLVELDRSIFLESNGGRLGDKRHRGEISFCFVVKLTTLEDVELLT